MDDRERRNQLVTQQRRLLDALGLDDMRGAVELAKDGAIRFCFRCPFYEHSGPGLGWHKCRGGDERTLHNSGVMAANEGEFGGEPPYEDRWKHCPRVGTSKVMTWPTSQPKMCEVCEDLDERGVESRFAPDDDIDEWWSLYRRLMHDGEREIRGAGKHRHLVPTGTREALCGAPTSGQPTTTSGE